MYSASSAQSSSARLAASGAAVMAQLSTEDAACCATSNPVASPPRHWRKYVAFAANTPDQVACRQRNPVIPSPSDPTASNLRPYPTVRSCTVQSPPRTSPYSRHCQPRLIARSPPRPASPSTPGSGAAAPAPMTLDAPPVPARPQWIDPLSLLPISIASNPQLSTFSSLPSNVSTQNRTVTPNTVFESNEPSHFHLVESNNLLLRPSSSRFPTPSPRSANRRSRSPRSSMLLAPPALVCLCPA